MRFTYAKTKRDLEEIADLMGRIFRRKNWFEFYKMRMDYQTRAPYYKPEHSRIAKEKGRILGHTGIIEKYLRISDCAVKTAGIGDVYTHPDARGRHVASHLMNDALSYMRKNNYPLSLLYGIPDFYHKFGYIEAMGNHKVFVPLKHVDKVSSSMNLRPSRDSDITVLNRLYNEAYGRKTGSVRRVPASWYNIANPRELFVVTRSKDRPAGYLIYKKVWGGGGYVPEVVAPTEEIRSAVLAFYVGKARVSFQAELEFRLSPDDSFARFLQDFGPRVVSQYFAEGEGNAMLRLVNLSRFLKAARPVLERRISHSPLAGKRGGMNIITDDAGKAFILFEKGRVKTGARVIKDLPTLNTPQNLLTRSVIGYWTVERLVSRLELAGYPFPRGLAPILEILFPPGNPFTLETDYF